MNFTKKIGPLNIFIMMLCALIIIVALYLFLRGDQHHAIFIGLWAPTILAFTIFLKQILNGGQ